MAAQDYGEAYFRPRAAVLSADQTNRAQSLIRLLYCILIYYAD